MIVPWWIYRLRYVFWRTLIPASRFEKRYAERSGNTVSELRRLGRIVVPCECCDRECRGWKSVSRNEFEFDAYLRMRRA